MDLVDSYVRAVAKALPEEQRDDISRELSEDIRSEMEDRQRELGRELTTAEQEALLKQHGNPLLLAARYRQDQRSLTIGRELIGPVLFPFYVRVLSFNLGLTFVVIGSIFLALTAAGQRLGLRDIASTCLLQLFIQLAVVTLIFALVQGHLTKHPDRWHLKGMHGGLALGLNIERDIESRIGLEMRGWGPRISRLESISIIIASVVAIAWIAGVQSYPFLILGPAAYFLDLAPVWYQVFFLILLLTAAEIVRATINLVRPEWVLFRMVYRIFLHAGGVAVAYLLLRAGTWVTASNGGANLPGGYKGTVEIVNQVFYWVLLFAVIFSAGTLIFRVVELIRKWRWHGDADGLAEAAKERN
jgi:hypothetical protein